MNKSEIISLLELKHQEMINWLRQHENENWDKGPEGKWTTGQHVLHLIQSEKPVNLALSLPKFILQYRYGRSNRSTRTYDQVVKKYHDKLKDVQGVVSPFSQNMTIPPPIEKNTYIARLDQENKKMQRKIDKWKEEDLDKYIVPHPLLGRMPLREIVMWTAYHTEHHLGTLEKFYK